MLQDKLKKIISLVLKSDDFDSSYKVAEEIIEQGLDVPSDLEGRLINYISDRDDKAFISLSEELLLKNALGDYVQNVRLIAFLGKRKLLPLKDVAYLLSSVPHAERSELPEGFIKALDAADLVCEDLKDGFMEATDDDLLSNALELVC